MRFFTLPALLAAALFSAVVVVPFLPMAQRQPDLFAIEARLRTDAPGQFQIFYDDGAGLREAASGRATVQPSADLITYRLPIAPGSYRGLRLDPLDRPGTVTIASLRVMTHRGRVLRELSPGDLKPSHQIQAATSRDQALEIVTDSQANDPQLTLLLDPPLEVRVSWRELLQGAAGRSLTVFLALAAGLFVVDRAPRSRARAAKLFQRLAARPILAIALLGVVAVAASAYPVVFLGKSYVSPNLGTVLLYDTYPTLPGYDAAEVADVKLSDIGAIMWQHVPFSMMQHRALRHGELPLWNRYNSAGTPLLGQGQSMFGDPLHLFVIAANGAAWAWDIKYLIAKWLFAVGLGLTVWGTTRHLGAASLVSGAAPFIGFFLYRINHPAFFSLCYAPLVLCCLTRIAQANARRDLAWWCLGLLAANLALMNSGTVKEAYMLLLCMNFSGACVVLASDAPWRVRLAKFGAIAWTGILFLLLAAPIWTTFLQTLKNAYTTYNAASAYQIQPSLLLGAFDEIFYRPLMSNNWVFSPSLNFLLLGGLLYFLATLRAQAGHRAAIAIALSSLVPLSLAFGLIPPAWIVRLPFLGNIAHLDNTFSCVLLVLWSVLAGVGFATAALRLGTREGRGDLAIAGLLLFALVFGWVGFRQAAHRPIFGPIFTVHQPGQVLAIAPFIWWYLASLLLALVALAWIMRHALVRRRATAAHVLGIAGCVAALLWRHGLHANAIGFEEFTARVTARANFHARSPAVESVRATQAKEPTRVFGVADNFFPGWSGVYGLEAIHAPDALVNPFLRELVGASGIERMWEWRLRAGPATIGGAQPFFDALNVRYYFDLRGERAQLTKSLHLVQELDLEVYESPSAWPRAFFTDRLDVYEQPAELVEKFGAAKGRPFAAMQRSELAGARGLAELSRDVGTRSIASATDYRLTENTTSFTVNATGPGVIVLTETLWPGDFRAEVNGRDTPVLRLNHAFKGVAIESAGTHRVSFRYWPRNFSRTLALAATGAVLAALSLFVALRRPRIA